MTTANSTQKTVLVPVTTLEEFVMPTDEEKAELLASLEEAEKDFEEGRYATFEPGEFYNYMLDEYQKFLKDKKHV